MWYISQEFGAKLYKIFKLPIIMFRKKNNRDSPDPKCFKIRINITKKKMYLNIFSRENIFRNVVLYKN